MARTTHAAVDRRVDPRRPADKPGFHGDSWLNRAAWPVSFLGATYLGAATYVYFKYGAERAQAWLDFLAGPAAIAALTILVTAGITVVRKVNQMAKGEMWSATAASTAASTKAEVATTREELGDTREELRRHLAGLARLMEGQGQVGREPDPTTGEIKALVKDLASRMSRIEATSAAAATNSTSALETVVHYGENLQAIASMATTTGDLKARTNAASGAARDSLRATQASSPSEPFPAPASGRPGLERPTGGGPIDALDDRFPHHRDPTSQQPAVPVADEQEDWRPGDDEQDDGEGLQTSQIQDFRARMAREDALERQAREAPTPRFPRAQPPSVPGWGPAPPAAEEDERARQKAARDQMRARQRVWDNPEEGPR